MTSNGSTLVKRSFYICLGEVSFMRKEIVETEKGADDKKIKKGINPARKMSN